MKNLVIALQQYISKHSTVNNVVALSSGDFPQEWNIGNGRF